MEVLEYTGVVHPQPPEKKVLVKKVGRGGDYNPIKIHFGSVYVI